MSLILYFSPLSPPSRAVRSFLLLSKAVFQGKVVDLLKGEHKSAEFSNINPNESLPALVDGGLKMFESHAILKYIAVKKQLYQYYPKNSRNRAQVDCYLDWSQTGLEAIGKYVNQCFLFPKFMNKPVPDNKQELHKDVIDTLKFFESTFLTGRYIFNQSAITLADIKATSDLSQLLASDLDFNQFPKIKEYLQEMFSIQPIKEAYAEYLQMINSSNPNDCVSYIINGVDKSQSWKITLYMHPFSSPSRAARTVLLFSGLDYNEKTVNLLQGEHKQPEYSAINPNQSIPAIVDENIKLFESGAVMKYVARKFNLYNLYPTQLQPKAKVDEYLDFHLTEMNSISKYTFSCFMGPQMMKLPIPADKDQQLQNVIGTLEFFSKVFLNNGKWQFINDSPQPTLADIKVGCDLGQLFITDFPFEKIPGLENYVKRLFDIPEMRRSHCEMFGFLQNQKIGRFAQSICQTQPLRSQERITLYFNFVSPPAKAAKSLLMLANIPFTEKVIDVQAGENKKKPFTDINPNESIPALSFGNFNLFETHAIMKFICIQFNLTDFYPNYPLRAKIDCYLDFHHSETRKISLFVLDFFFGPKFLKREMPKNQEDREREVSELLHFIVNVFFAGGKYKYVMGSRTPTIADLSLICEITTLFFVDFDFSQFPTLKAYLKDMFNMKQVRETYSKFFMVTRFMSKSMNPFIESIAKGTEEGGSSCCQLI
ncbi:unnamed protein product [Paramecium pentaurelia]|uniref:Glutathione S-transferase n=1 Tax=Paramecium pentaurelia TaxID=43138 RepID=A0A8S1SF40_9CILI|nr:unnamed protein product [Paramecium pentaurelia]